MITAEQQLARAGELLRQHRLHNWRVDFADLSQVPTKNLFGGASFGALGICKFFQREILIDVKLIGREYQFLQTVKHEIAHALLGRRGHDQAWLKIARQVGCTKRELEPYTWRLA